MTDAVKERPILFSGSMVRAILDGSKTQTRRVVKPMAGLQKTWLTEERLNTSKLSAVIGGDGGMWAAREHEGGGPGGAIRSPYGKPGDRLVVRETFALHHAWDDFPPSRGGPASKRVWFRADETTDIDGRGKWRPSIHMPRWASRITLEVTSVRVERLHKITEEDAKAEGAPVENGHHIRGAWFGCGPSHREGFAQLWQDINGTESWAASPWVWVIGFRRLP